MGCDAPVGGGGEQTAGSMVGGSGGGQSHIYSSLQLQWTGSPHEERPLSGPAVLELAG